MTKPREFLAFARFSLARSQLYDVEFLTAKETENLKSQDIEYHLVEYSALEAEQKKSAELLEALYNIRDEGNNRGIYFVYEAADKAIANHKGNKA